MNSQVINHRLRELEKVTGGASGCGWMCDEVAKLLYSLIQFYRPSVVIQTGHLWGRSSVFILEALTDMAIFNEAFPQPESQGDAAFNEFVDRHEPAYPSGCLISIDPAPFGVPNQSAGYDLLKLWYGTRFTFLSYKSHEYFATAPDYGTDRIFGIVDGDHTEEGCMKDLEGFAKLKAEVIFVDDTTWIPALEEVCKSFAATYDYHAVTLRLYNGVTILTRG